MELSKRGSQGRTKHHATKKAIMLSDTDSDDDPRDQLGFFDHHDEKCLPNHIPEWLKIVTQSLALKPAHEMSNMHSTVTTAMMTLPSPGPNHQQRPGQRRRRRRAKLQRRRKLLQSRCLQGNTRLIRSRMKKYCVSDVAMCVFGLLMQSLFHSCPAIAVDAVVLQALSGAGYFCRRWHC